MKDKKRIIFSSYDELKNPFYAGGGATAIYEITKRLKNKYKITVICGKYKNYKDYSENGIFYKHIGLSVSARLGQLIYQMYLPFYAMFEKYDLWIESFTPPFSTAILPLFTKHPVIGLVHMLSGVDMRRKYKLPFDFFEKKGIKFYKYFIVLTHSDFHKIKNIHKKALIEIIPNGIDISKSSIKIKRKHLLYIGRIEINQKGIDLMLNSYKMISNSTTVPLIIAGGGTNDQINKLKKIIKNLNLDKKVKYIGKVNVKKRNELYKYAYAVIIPSRFETFSLVALEALANKRALITYSIDGLSWIPAELRYRAENFNIDNLSKQMLDVLTNSKKRISIEKMEVDFVKKFNWNNITKKYSYFINSIFMRKDLAS